MNKEIESNVIWFGKVITQAKYMTNQESRWNENENIPNAESLYFPIHCIDVMSASWRLKSPVCWLSANNLFIIHADSKANINAPHHWHFVGLSNWLHCVHMQNLQKTVRP